MKQQQAVVIVGAGPAGCSAARELARAGITGIICERGMPHKEKPCGDAYTPDAVAALHEWGLDADGLAALGGWRYQRVIIEGFGQRYDDGDATQVSGWVIRRAAVDQWLRDQIHDAFPIHYGVTVTQIRRCGDGFEVMTRSSSSGEPAAITCGAVILATGAANHLSRAWGIDGQPVLGASLSLYAQGAPPPGLEFRFAKDLQAGYAWVFPMRDQLNIGVCALKPTSAATLRARANVFAQAWQPHSGMTWRGGGHALWSGEGIVWHEPTGIVSCGDAAGLTDPHSAEGLTAAFRSGAAAGAAIAGFLADRRSAALADYSAWVKDFGTRHYQTLTAPLLLWRMWAGV